MDELVVDCLGRWLVRARGFQAAALALPETTLMVAVGSVELIVKIALFVVTLKVLAVMKEIACMKSAEPDSFWSWYSCNSFPDSILYDHQLYFI